MTDKAHINKEEYFQQLDLLNVSDDEVDIPNDSLKVLDEALADSSTVRPPSNSRGRSSFNGPTPKEIQAKMSEFEAHAAQQRARARDPRQKFARFSTVAEMEMTSFPESKQRPVSSKSFKTGHTKLKRESPLPDVRAKNEVPFYKQVGSVPRELNKSKNAKLADNIKLEAERKQLLRYKIVYFYPNDDICMARRARIHKVIQLGAAWTKIWRDDITYVIVDGKDYTYGQLLRHLKLPGLPKGVILVKFDPYIPRCIEWGKLQDPFGIPYVVKGAPKKDNPIQETDEPESCNSTQASLQIKPAGGKTTSRLGASKPMVSSSQPSPTTVNVPSSPIGDIVEDSFIVPTSDVQGDAPISDLKNKPHQKYDGLVQVIEEMKVVAHLPLDDDEDETHTGITDQDTDSGTDEEPPPRRSPTSKKLKGTGGPNQTIFQCMAPNTSTADPINPNAHTISILTQMCTYYTTIHDDWRALAYRRAISTLKKQPTLIRDAATACTLPFIGPRLALKIQEIALTRTLRRLDSALMDPTTAALETFTAIYGVGITQANKWVAAGHRTLADIHTHEAARLTPNQRVGLEKYGDFNTRIPRAQVARHGAVVADALVRLNPHASATIMGSYRRGAADSGDIDVMITAGGLSLGSLRALVFEGLVPALKEAGFVVAELAASKGIEGSKWHGASVLPGGIDGGIWRRLDLLVVPEPEVGAALLYFTGNDIFNRSMRLLARRKNMRLNQKGLYSDVKRGRYGEKLDQGTLVEGRCERKIFEALGVPWREPWERIC